MKDKEKALKRWKPLLEKLGVPIGEKLDMLSEYAQAHHDALNNSEMPDMTVLLQGPTNLKIPNVSIMDIIEPTYPLAYKTNNQPGFDFNYDNNVDDHF